MLEAFRGGQIRSHGLPGGVRARIQLLAACGAFACSSVSSPPPETESPAPQSVSSDPQIAMLLERTCYQCHANEGEAPWSAAFAPSYWFAGGARKTLDFDAWAGYDAQRRDDELRAIAKVVRDGEMPPWDYTPFDAKARLTPQEQQLVADWADHELATSTR